MIRFPLRVAIAAAASRCVLATTLAAPVELSPVSVSCPAAEGWKLNVPTSFARQPDGTETLTLTLDRATPAPPPAFAVTFSAPQVDMPHVWAPAPKPIPFVAYDSCYAGGMPVYALYDDAETNRIAFALSEVVRRVTFRPELDEVGNVLHFHWQFFARPEAPISHWEATLRIDRRARFWSEAVAESADWAARASGAHVCPTPDAAREPVYSSWYAFHQDLSADAIEAECRIAVALGMKTVIVDDGWMTDDNRRGYAFCGDWNVSARRFPDWDAHVSAIHALGMKYMLWYAVPFVGEKSAAAARFRGKFLRTMPELGTSVLDPRFPEVRSYLTDVFARAARDMKIDGFKLDFIGQFRIMPGETDPAIAENYAGRDYTTVEDAADALMRDIHARLAAANPSVLIEFRQGYIGPKIRQCGNMIRASDCPGDKRANRLSTVNLRLTSGDSAVHSDMLAWNPAENVESAARNVLNVLFSTVQYSMMLRNLDARQTDMVRHWIAFQRQHRNALLKGAFRPHLPHLNYPWAVAEDRDERIIGVYQPGLVIPVGAADRTVYVVNATTDDALVLDLPAPTFAALSFDTCGRSAGVAYLPKGVNRVKVPRSGYVKIAYARAADALASDVVTGSPLHIVNRPEHHPEVIFSNRTEEARHWSGKVRVSDYWGHANEKEFSLSLGGGAAKRFPLDDPKDFGIYRVDVLAEGQDGSTSSNRLSFAKIRPREATPRSGKGVFRPGINCHYHTFDAATRKVALEGLAAAGAKLMRGQILNFGLVCPTADIWRWEEQDRMVDELLSAGIDIDAIVASFPPWAKKDRSRFPPRPGVFGDYCRALAKRYGTRVAYYEIGNEWDLGPLDALTVDEAIAIQREAYEAIKGACPESVCIPNGWALDPFAPNPALRPGFQTVFMDRARAWCDAHPIHIHGFFPDYAQGLARLFDYRRKRGLEAMPWYSNETAMTTVRGREDAVAADVWRKMLYAWGHGSVDYIWYNLRATGTDPADGEQGFGLMTRDFRPRAGYAAFSALADVFGQLSADGILCEKDGRFIGRWKGRQDNAEVIVLAGWDSRAATPSACCVRTDAAHAARADLMGNRHPLAVADGIVAWPIGKEPTALVLVATRADL